MTDESTHPINSSANRAIAAFYQRRAAQASQQPILTQRPTCPQCRKAMSTCYCHRLRPFTAPYDFVILQHPDEAKNTIATARMAHLSIRNSQLFVGRDFSEDERVNTLLNDDRYRHLLLYPSRQAKQLDDVLQIENETAYSQSNPRPIVFWVLDAKWHQVPQMLRLSPNVRAMSMVQFVPDRESQFRVRQQPDKHYLSTIEAIHTVIDHVTKRLSSSEQDRVEPLPHDALIEVFQHFVQQQVDFVKNRADCRHKRSYLARRLRETR